MKSLISEIIDFIKNKEKWPSLNLIVLIIITILAIFQEDFNTLKILIFLILIILIFNFLLIQYLKIKTQKDQYEIFFSFVEKIFDSFNEGIVIYDEDFKIVFANKLFADLVKLTKEELKGLPITQEMLKSEKYKLVANLFFPFITGEDLKMISQTPEIIEVKFEDPEEKYLLITYIEFYLNKKYKLRIILDRTQIIIENIRKLEFIQLIAHNFLTPLTQIKWNLESIDPKNLLISDKELLSSTLEITETAVIFTETFLTLAKSEFGKLELNIIEVDLKEMIEIILKLLKNKIRDKNLKVNVEIEPGLTKILADKSIILLSLFVFLENAVVYNKDGGLVEIKIQKLKNRPYLEILIRDTGIGMSKVDLANLFKKYYRGKIAKEINVKGLGIGLTNAKAIIDYHGGEIKIESEEGQGTTVFINLPLDPNFIPHYRKNVL